MKRRILSIVCAIAVLATMLTVGIFASSADSSNIITGFKADEWTKVSGDDLAFMDFEEVTDAVRISNKNGTYTAGKYNLGSDFHVAFSAFMTWDNDNANSHHAVYIGDLTVMIDRTKAAGNNNSGYGKVIVSKGTTELARSASTRFLKNTSTETNEAVVKHYDNIATSDKYFGGRIEADYASGNLTVKVNGATLVSTAVAGLDLSNAEVKFSAGGGWQTQTLFDFELSSNTYSAGSSSAPASSEAASSAPAGPLTDVNITDGLNQTDWTGDTANIYELQAGGFGFLSSSNKSVKTITSVASYNLGSDWESSISLRTTYNSNRYGQPYVLKIGALEAIVYNYKNAVASPEAPAEDAYIELKKDGATVGEKVLIANIADATSNGNVSGVLTLSYKNGTATVNFNGTDFITENVGEIDFSDVNASLSIMGNWADKSIGVANFKLKGEQAPVSSAPVSSEPESSEASSEPTSSATDSSESASSDAVSSEPDAPEKVTTAISGALVAEDWDPSDKIVNGVLGTGSNVNVELITSVKKYDLGTDWTASIKFTTPTYMGNDAAQPTKLIVGDVEAIAYNSHQGNGTDAYLALNVKGNEVGTFSLGEGSGTRSGNTYGGTLEIVYKNGAITVKHNDATVITYDATADNLDFSAVNFGLSVKGNWQNEKNFKIKEFAVKTADSYVEPGAPIVNVTDGVFNATDWVGDVENIDAEESYFYTTGSAANKKTITTAKAYDLSKGFKFSSTLKFKSHYANYGGEWAAIYVGDTETGIELRIQNQKGQGLYDAFILVKGEEVASASLLNAPNGKYELVYKNGKLTVNLEGAAIKWTLKDKSNATAVAISNVDMTKTTLGLHIQGNWAPKDLRNWSGYSLTSLSGGAGGANGSTGDARNLVIPAVAIILGACAVAFVAKSRKANA